MAAERSRLAFDPKFEGPFAAWTYKYVNANLWKFADQYTFEDMIQEAAMKFAVCVRKYPMVDEPKHFMALYKQAVANHFIKLAKKASLNRAHINDNYSLSIDADDEHPKFEPAGEQSPAELMCLWRTAPVEVKRLIKLLASGKLRNEPMWRYANGTRETSNEYWARQLGLDPAKVDLFRMARSHFFPEAYGEGHS
jgi:hypothetical protein